MTTDRDAYDIGEFCARHAISKSFLYLLWKRGEGPVFMMVGHKRLIGREAASAWRRDREQASQLTAA